MPEGKTNLWHYTTLEGLEGILRDQCLWATHFRYLNDVSEFEYSKQILGDLFFPDIKKIIEDYCGDHPEANIQVQEYGGIDSFSKLETNDTLEILYLALLTDSPIKDNRFYSMPCLLSFSNVNLDDNFIQENGLLSQWRGYGVDGGYALIFDKEQLCRFFEEEKSFYYYVVADNGDVHYCRGDKTVFNNLKENFQKDLKYLSDFFKDFFLYRIRIKEKPIVRTEHLNAITRCMAFFKHGGFFEEKEHRFYVFPSPPSYKNALEFQEIGKEFKEILFRQNVKGLIPYIRLFQTKNNKRLPIKRICVGPHKSSKERILSIKQFLKVMNLNDIEVFASSIPFIENK